MPCIIDTDILAAPKSTFKFRTTNKAYEEVARVRQRVTNDSKFAIIVDTKNSNCLTAEMGTIYSQKRFEHIEYLVNITITGRGTVMKAEEYIYYPEYVSSRYY